MIALGLCGLFVSLYNIDWHRHPNVKNNGLLVNVLLATAVCAIVAFGSMVVMAEIMALCGAFLTGCVTSGKLWFALGRLGTILLAIACLLLWQRYDTLDLALLAERAQDAANRFRYLGAVRARFLACWPGLSRCTAGLPQAHANASAPAAALFSAVVMKSVCSAF